MNMPNFASRHQAIRSSWDGTLLLTSPSSRRIGVYRMPRRWFQMMAVTIVASSWANHGPVPPSSRVESDLDVAKLGQDVVKRRRGLSEHLLHLLEVRSEFRETGIGRHEPQGSGCGQIVVRPGGLEVSAFVAGRRARAGRDRPWPSGRKGARPCSTHRSSRERAGCAWACLRGGGTRHAG